MLSSLKNLIWSSKRKNGSSEEVIIPISYNDENKSPNAARMGNRGFVSPPGGEHGWKDYVYNNQIMPEHDTVRDISKYNGRRIVGEIADEIKKEAYKIQGNTVELVDLEESKDENGIIHPTLRIALSEDRPVNLKSLLDTNQCKEHNVDAITLCHSDKDKTRGARLRVDEEGTRIYEVANGTYEMFLNWYVEGQECRMKISISDDGFVTFLDRNGVTNKQILAHREVKIGKQHEAKFLGEALGLQPAKAQTQMKNLEGMVALSQKTVKTQCPYPTTLITDGLPQRNSKAGATQEQPSTDVNTQCPYPIIDLPQRSSKADTTQKQPSTDVKTQCPYPTTLVKDFVTKSPEVKSALKELGSELQKGGSEVAKPSTSVTTTDVKEVGEKKGEQNISSPNR